MTPLVFIYDEMIVGEVLSLMAYGAIVKYSAGGIEFTEMLSSEDYRVLTDLDELEEDSDE